jgi:hypothetical protein
VEVRLGWRAERLQRTASGLEVQGGGGRGVSSAPPTGERAGPYGEADAAAYLAGSPDGLSAEAVIVAVPHTRAAGLLEPLLADCARKLGELRSSPIVNLHVVYDRPVCEQPFAAGVGTPVQYLFDRTAAAGAPAGCQYLAVSLSGAEREMGMSVDALRELLPRARGARVESFLATREHAATFRAAPGVQALRPGPETEVPGLLLAGAWTATGGPATLEGAVLSGHAAAASALRRLGIEPGEADAPPPAIAVPELPSARGAAA